MGSNQVKVAAISKLLPQESIALSSQDDQERKISKGGPRRLGSMELSQWILMKRREQDILKKAQKAVNDGAAPREILEKVEKYITKESKKPCIKYHPKIVGKKPKRPRIKPPRLTNTAARRIQDAIERREKERQQEKKTNTFRKQAKSQVNVRSQGWTNSAPLEASRKAEIAKKRRQRSSSVPPTSTLSLQSITTAESSGIGMSRASSISSVVSTKQKPYYTRQRVSKYTTNPGQNTVVLRPPQCRSLAQSRRQPQHNKTTVAAMPY